MHEVNYNGQTSYVSNYSYCGMQQEGLLYDAERDLLAIARFLDIKILCYFYYYYHYYHYYYCCCYCYNYYHHHRHH